jgi:hypothetical protein
MATPLKAPKNKSAVRAEPIKSPSVALRVLGGNENSRHFGLMSGNAGRYEGAIAEKAVPFQASPLIDPIPRLRECGNRDATRPTEHARAHLFRIAPTALTPARGTCW